jgi:hypothetical protein
LKCLFYSISEEKWQKIIFDFIFIMGYNCAMERRLINTALLSSLLFLTSCEARQSVAAVIAVSPLNTLPSLPRREFQPVNEQEKILKDYANKTLRIVFEGKTNGGGSVYPLKVNLNGNDFVALISVSHVLENSSCRDFTLFDKYNRPFFIEGGTYSTPSYVNRKEYSNTYPFSEINEAALILVPLSEIKTNNADYKFIANDYDERLFIPTNDFSIGIAAGYSFDRDARNKDYLNIFKVKIIRNAVFAPINHYVSNEEKQFYSMKDGISGGPVFFWNSKTNKPFLIGGIGEFTQSPVTNNYPLIGEAALLSNNEVIPALLNGDEASRDKLVYSESGYSYLSRNHFQKVKCP